jgi:curli biogenesis system outer membrane secretion channel CsgG
MRIRHFFLSLLALAAVTVPGFAQKRLSKEEKSKLPRIAILEFKAAPDCWHGWNHGGWGNQMGTISNQIRDMFTTEIMEKGRGKIRVIERERLSEIRDELNFQQSGEVDTSTVQKIGKLLGVKYVMTGKVTRFAYKESGISGGWGLGAVVGKVTGSSLAGSLAGDMKLKKASFTGRLDIRLIEVETGEILFAKSEEEKVADHSVKIAGTGTEVSYDEELVNKVFEPIVKRLTPKLVRATGLANEEEE